MKLTTRQKELIKLMQEGGTLRTKHRTAYIFSGGFTILVHFLTVGSLIHNGLISNIETTPANIKHYSLTEEGKKVKI